MNESRRSFHYDKSEYSTTALLKAQQNGKINEDEVRIIQEFILEMHATRGTSNLRRTKFTYSLILWRKYLPDYFRLTYSELLNGLSAFRVAKSPKGLPYSQNSVHDHIIQLKRFLLWSIENGYTDNLSTKQIKKIKQPDTRKRMNIECNILTQSEVKKILSSCQDIQYRAIISILYEGGLRAGEVASLTWDFISWHSRHIGIRTSGKTGKPRYIPITQYMAPLKKWRKNYPGIAKGNNLVFVRKDGSMIPYYELRHKIEFFVNLAGITKKVTLHTFRHSRITHLVKKGVNENIIKKMMWGDIGTNMFDTYVHLSDDDISEITYEHYGIKNCTEEKKTKKLDTITIRACPRCKIIHSPKNKHCHQCGSILPEVDVEKEVYLELKKYYYENFKYQW